MLCAFLWFSTALKTGAIRHIGEMFRHKIGFCGDAHGCHVLPQISVSCQTRSDTVRRFFDQIRKISVQIFITQRISCNESAEREIIISGKQLNFLNMCTTISSGSVKCRSSLHASVCCCYACLVPKWRGFFICICAAKNESPGNAAVDLAAAQNIIDNIDWLFRTSSASVAQWFPSVSKARPTLWWW